MSAEQFQKRLSDLIFSAKEHIKELETEQNASQDEYDAWEMLSEDLDDEERVDHENEIPEVVDNSVKINAIEAAIEHLDKAVNELDKALGA